MRRSILGLFTRQWAVSLRVALLIAQLEECLLRHLSKGYLER
jgi:hypothetical protein